MDIKWKKRLLYWALAMGPLFSIMLLGRIISDPFFFVLFLLFYVFIYRPLLDTQRLMSLGELEEKDAWRFFVPFAVDQTKYIKALWLG